jgi:hypothetical protein
MAMVGAAGGLASYGLIEILPDMVTNDRILLVVFLIVIGFFIELMSLAGPVPLRKAVGPSLAMATGVALLMCWASFRFETVEQFLESGHPAAALFIIYLIGTPFLSAWCDQDQRRSRWLDYANLFQTAWGLIVRGFAAAVFTGLFWGVVFLCDLLLELVNIDVIEQLLELDPMPFVITGAVTGLALAVAYEWREYVSPHLLLRLLRLLVPVLVLVLGVFIVAVGLGGLDGALGFLSETSLLTGAAIGAITLVTVAVDRDTEHEVRARWMVGLVRLLSVLLLPVALLAAWGIYVRVQQYGWTPERILGSIWGAVVLLYAVTYAALALRRGGWMSRLRRANVILALVSLAVALLWLTPILNAERIASVSQVTRILEGQIPPDKAAIWEMRHDWGRAGTQGITTLRSAETYPDRDAVLARIERADTAPSRWAFMNDTDPAGSKDLANRLFAQVPVYPAGQILPATAFEGIGVFDQRRILSGCETKLEDGAPGCAFVFASFFPSWPEKQGVVLFRVGPALVDGEIYRLKEGKLNQLGGLGDIAHGGQVRLEVEALQDIRSGTYRLEPTQVNQLMLGGYAIFPDN